MKYTRDEFIKAAKESFSIRQLLIKINLASKGGGYVVARKRIQDWNVDISHFTGRGNLKGGHHNWAKKTPLEDILLKGSKYKGGSCKLKNKLIQENIFERKCYRCGNVSWENHSIPLELEHINGDSFDNRLSNLTLLCPNCHALTSTYCGKNQKRKGINKTKCINCGKVIRNNITGKCNKCRNYCGRKKIKFSGFGMSKEVLAEKIKNSSCKNVSSEINVPYKLFRKICREENILIPYSRSKIAEARQIAIDRHRKFHVNKEELEKLVQQNSMLALGRMFNVSGNAVKKRCKFFGIDWRKKKIA